MSIQQINIGNPNSPNISPVTGVPYASPVAIPDVANTRDGRLLFLNRSGCRLNIQFNGNSLAFIIEPNGQRLVKLREAENGGFSFTVLDTLYFLPFASLDVELYAPEEEVPFPFEMASNGYPSPLSGAGQQGAGVTLTGTVAGGIPDYPLFQIATFGPGLYQFSLQIYTLDGNLAPNGDRLRAFVAIVQGDFPDQSPSYDNFMTCDISSSSTPNFAYLDGTHNVPGGGLQGLRPVLPMHIGYGTTGHPLAPSSIGLYVGVAPLASGSYTNPPKIRCWGAITNLGS